MSWKIISRRTAFDNPWRKVEAWRVKQPNGRTGEFFFSADPDVVMVFALTAKEEVIVNRQHNIHLGRRLWELPAGCMETETPLAAAKRELREETGYTAGRWLKLKSLHLGKWSLGRAHFYLALGARKTHEQELEESEDIVVERIPLARYPALLADGTISSTLCHGASYEALACLESLGYRTARQKLKSGQGKSANRRRALGH